VTITQASKDEAFYTGDDADDEPLPVVGDWREFRANLVAQSQVESVIDSLEDIEEGELESRIDVERRSRVQKASGENIDLLKKQGLSSLAENLPWAHPIAVPEKGCLLLANAFMFLGNQQYFNQAVVLLIEHNESGSMGIILNRPTQYDMGQVTDQAGPFESNPVYFGGDVGDGAVSLIHGRRDVTNSLEIRPGLYLGGMDCAKQMVTDGQAKPEEFKFFARYAGWGPGQLESEAERDVWYVAASAKELVLKPVIKLPKPLYREILELMGGEYSETARKAFSEDPSGENL